MKTRTEKIEDFLSNLTTEIDILNCVDCENIESYDDIYNQIEENQGFEIEIIYSSNAIEYLANNDPSLQESCNLAFNMGYDVSNINSELLATLLASQNAREEFQELKNEIDEFFEELEELEEEE